MKNEGAEQWSAPLMAVAKTWSHLLFQQILLEPLSCMCACECERAWVRSCVRACVRACGYVNACVLYCHLRACTLKYGLNL